VWPFSTASDERLHLDFTPHTNRWGTRIDNLPQRLVIAHRLFSEGVTPMEFLLFHEELMSGYLKGSSRFSVLNY
jgi:hypothetical protein